MKQTSWFPVVYNFLEVKIQIIFLGYTDSQWASQTSVLAQETENMALRFHVGPGCIRTYQNAQHLILRTVTNWSSMGLSSSLQNTQEVLQ